MTDEKVHATSIDEKLDLGLRTDTSQPLLIDFNHLLHHGAVLAQSGAGKSTIVGRIVEEILIKTDATVVVIDANADFRKAHLVADATGNRGRDRTGRVLRLDDSSENEFESRWHKEHKVHLTNLPASDQTTGVEWIVPRVSWNALPPDWQMEVLGLELSRNPDEVAALYRVAQRLGPSDMPVSPDTAKKELYLLASTSTVMNPLSERTAVSLQMRFQQAVDLDLWRQKADHADISQCFEKGRPRGLLVLDVPSVKNPKGAKILVAYLLEELWKAARREWDEAVADPINDDRTPTFLVVDEAHNFVPFDDPPDPLALRISLAIQRIAAEGRKYGIFLLLATQRPPKVRRGLLSECENVCLLHLQSPIDRKLAVEIWGLEESHATKVSPIANFKKSGEGLLWGHWAGESPEVQFRGGRRRTKETGGNLRKNWIRER